MEHRLYDTKTAGVVRRICCLLEVPSHVLRLHILDMLTPWCFARVGLVSKALKEAVFEDVGAWRARVAMYNIRETGGALTSTRVGRQRARIWSGVHAAATSVDDAECDRLKLTRMEGARQASIQELLTKLDDIDGPEVDLTEHFDVAISLASLATPWDLARLIEDRRPLAKACGLIAAFLRSVDESLSPVESMVPLSDEGLVRAVVNARDDPTCYRYRAKVWGLGSLQLYRLRDSIHSSRASVRQLSEAILYFIAPRLELAYLAHDSAEVASAFAGFIEGNCHKYLPMGIRHPVLIVDSSDVDPATP